MALRFSDPLEAFFIAAREGDAETVRQLIRNGEVTTSTGIYDSRDDGITALHYAALHGHENVIKELLEAGADIDASSNWHFQSLQASRYTYKTALQCAHESGYFGALSLLTIEGADLLFEEFDDSHDGPLNMAIVKGDIELIEMFYKKSPCFPTGCGVLHFASKYSDPKTLRAMLTMGMDHEERDIDSCTPLHEAVKGNENKVRFPDNENVRLLLEYGANKEAIVDTEAFDHYDDDEEPGPGGYDDIGCTPLLLSIVYRNTKAFHLLADRGANLLVKTADFTGDFDMLIGNRTGLHLMADVLRYVSDKDKETHNANILSMMKRLVGAGVAVDALDTEGCTALHRAVVTANSVVVDFLLENGADLAVKATNVETFVRHGENFAQYSQETGFTPLFLALVSQHTDIIQKLLYHGANLLDRDDHGRTVLHLACCCYSTVPISAFTVLLNTLQVTPYSPNSYP